ncbi:hypothetical protein E4T43_05703 [Aureobasidium subglaciale]|nr:hypothetical protein E4T43_05703 [Aureobasidium subglaciale]
MHPNTTPDYPRCLSAGIGRWTDQNTVPAGPQNAPQPQTAHPSKKSKWPPVFGIFRAAIDDDTHGSSCRCVRCLHACGALKVQVADQPQREYSFKHPRPAPAPPRRPTPPPRRAPPRPATPGPAPRRRNSSPTTPMPRPTTRRYQTVAQQPQIVAPRPIAPISISALNATCEPAPPSPAISVTISEPDFDQTRFNRMSTYSYLDGHTDLSAFDDPPYADYFAPRIATPVVLTRASSTAVNIPAMRGLVFNNATPVSSQKAKLVEVLGPRKRKSVANAVIPVLSATQILGHSPTRPTVPGPARQPQIVRPSRVESSAASLYFDASPESPSGSPSSTRAEKGSVKYFLGSDSSCSSASLTAPSDNSSDSLGSHAKIVKRVLTEALDRHSLIKKPLVGRR